MENKAAERKEQRVCKSCGEPGQATARNQGYSDCCNESFCWGNEFDQLRAEGKR